MVLDILQETQLNHSHLRVSGVLRASVGNQLQEVLNTNPEPLTLDILRERNTFTKSVSLPPNNHTYSEYNISPAEQLKSTHNDIVATGGSSYKFYPEQTDKHDSREANVGWKIHLNVIPENIWQVAEYLIKSKYHHKYFHGWEVEDGKIYTVYVWSRALTERCAKSIHDDIWSCLAMPMSKDEIEFQTGIVWRFVAKPKQGNSKYDQYGSIWIVHLYELRQEWLKMRSLYHHIERIKSLGILETEFNNTKRMLAGRAVFPEWRVRDIGNCSHRYATYADMRAFVLKQREIDTGSKAILKACEEQSFDELLKDYGAYFTG